MRSAIHVLLAGLAVAHAAPAAAQSYTVAPGGASAFGWRIAAPKGVFNGGGSNVRAPRPASAVPLSIAECRGLGGQVYTYAVCKSGSVCIRESEDGKTHRVCISKS